MIIKDFPSYRMYFPDDSV